MTPDDDAYTVFRAGGDGWIAECVVGSGCSWSRGFRFKADAHNAGWEHWNLNHNPIEQHRRDTQLREGLRRLSRHLHERKDT